MESWPHYATCGWISGLADEEEIAEFGSRLSREWAIETGIIESVYTLERGVTETLISKGIDANLIPHESTNRDPAEVATIIQDHIDALESLFAFVKGVKGGVKLDHRGGGKVDQFTGSWGFGLRDLRGRLERRPATRFAGRV